MDSFSTGAATAQEALGISSSTPAMTGEEMSSSFKPNIATAPANLSLSSHEPCGIAGHPNKHDAQSTIANKPQVEEILQPRILPLLGKPYFTCIMCKSHVQTPFQVVIPRSFAPFLPTMSAPATLTLQGRSWGLRLTCGRVIQRLEAGWRGFVVDNRLRLGDACVFELVDGEQLVFRVQVLHADIPASIRESAGGCTSNSPILID